MTKRLKTRLAALALALFAVLATLACIRLYEYVDADAARWRQRFAEGLRPQAETAVAANPWQVTHVEKGKFRTSYRFVSGGNENEPLRIYCHSTSANKAYYDRLSSGDTVNFQIGEELAPINETDLAGILQPVKEERALEKAFGPHN